MDIEVGNDDDVNNREMSGSPVSFQPKPDIFFSDPIFVPTGANRGYYSVMAANTTGVPLKVGQVIETGASGKPNIDITNDCKASADGFSILIPSKSYTREVRVSAKIPYSSFSYYDMTPKQIPVYIDKNQTFSYERNFVSSSSFDVDGYVYFERTTVPVYNATTGTYTFGYPVLPVGKHDFLLRATENYYYQGLFNAEDGACHLIAEGKDTNNQPCYLISDYDYFTGPKVKSNFLYTQHYILNTLIPKLKMARNSYYIKVRASRLRPDFSKGAQEMSIFRHESATGWMNFTLTKENPLKLTVYDGKYDKTSEVSVPVPADVNWNMYQRVLLSYHHNGMISFYINNAALDHETLPYLELPEYSAGSGRITFGQGFVGTMWASTPKRMANSPKRTGLSPEEEQTLDITILKDLNIGTYDVVLYLKTDEGLVDPLALTIRKTGTAPEWAVDKGKLRNMQICAQVLMAGNIHGSYENPIQMTATLEITQDLALNDTWSWVSLNVASPLASDVNRLLKKGLWSNGDQLKDPEAQSFYTYNLGKWTALLQRRQEDHLLKGYNHTRGLDHADPGVLIGRRPLRIIRIKRILPIGQSPIGRIRLIRIIRS